MTHNTSAPLSDRTRAGAQHDPIRAALREAAKAAQKAIAAEPCIDQGGVCQMPPYPCTCALAIAAATIAAFLRAIPQGASVLAGQGDLRASVGPMPALAAAVERAAREGNDA